MKNRLILTFLAAVVPVLAVAGLATASAQSGLADAREATAAYHDIDAARAAGYTVELHESVANGGLTDGSCISNKDTVAGGAMGVHMVNGALVDGVIDAAQPEALLYEKRNDGTFKLIGVEYVSTSPGQSVFGVALAPTDVSRFFGPGATLHTLHAWLWKPNPNGALSPWNTRVSCDS